MRDESPQGGRQDRTIDLQAAGYMSTGALSSRVGLCCTMSASFIINELGVLPRMKGPTGNGYYWAPEQVRDVRRALILHLLAIELEG